MYRFRYSFGPGCVSCLCQPSKSVTKLNEVNRGYNDGRDILTFASPYIKHHDGIYNVTIFPIPKPEDTSGLSISTDSSEYNDHNSSSGIADGGINYSINQMMDHDIVDATQEGIRVWFYNFL